MLKELRESTGPGGSEDEITEGLVKARKSLGIRVYTAATLLELKPSQNLVCQLEKNGPAGSDEVLRIEPDQNHELRMVIKNIPDSHEHESTEADDDPIHIFHSLHFYKAIKEDIRDQYLLSDESRQQKYVKKQRAAQITTGGMYPCCPIGFRIRETPT
jgi:hypothetical protein